MDRVKMAYFEIPLMDICVPAGFPSPAADYLEETINLNNYLIAHPEATFLVKCSGFSMIEAFIPPVALLLVDRSLDAKSGDIVLAYINNGFTVKYLHKDKNSCCLLPANKSYGPISITDDSGLIIWGVVIKIIADPKDYRHACFS